MKVYLDSSAFAKRFVEEHGSREVEELCARTSELGLSIVCIPEIISAMNRRRREKFLTGDEYADVKRRFAEDVRDVDVIQLTDSVMLSAISVLETSPIRTLDALHIACALEWRADLFASSDRKQILAARRAGLRTILL